MNYDEIKKIIILIFKGIIAIIVTCAILTAIGSFIFYEFAKNEFTNFVNESENTNQSHQSHFYQD